MRLSWKIATALLLGMLAAGARAGQPRVAVFDFELVDTSLEGATYGPRVDQQVRLAQMADQLRDQLAKSGRVAVVDIAPVAAQAKAADLLRRLRGRACAASGSRFFGDWMGPESLQSDPQHEHSGTRRENRARDITQERRYARQY